MKLMRARYFFIFAVACALVTSAFLFHPAHSQGEDAAAAGEAWQVRCVKPEGEEKEVCEVFQRLSMKDTGQRLMELAILKSRTDKGMHQGVVVLPLGIKVMSGVQMQIDDGEAYRFNISHCEANGCIAFLDVDKKLLSEMKKGKSLNLVVVAANGQAIKVVMTLDGLAKAHKKL